MTCPSMIPRNRLTFHPYFFVAARLAVHLRVSGEAFASAARPGERLTEHTSALPGSKSYVLLLQIFQVARAFRVDHLDS